MSLQKPIPMKKGVFGSVKAKGLKLMVFGNTFTDKTVEQLRRAKDLGIVIGGPPKTAKILKDYGINVISFIVDGQAGALDYPKSGLPASVVEQIMLTGSNAVHAIFAEITEQSGVVGTADSIDGVIKEIHYNVTDGLMKGLGAGRITMTSADSLENFLDIMENGDNQMTAEVYGAVATINAVSTMEAIEDWMGNLAGSAKPFIAGANTVLEEAGVLQTEERE